MKRAGTSFAVDPLRIHRARPEHLGEIRRLLHRTFVAELGQYPDDGSGLHLDKFENKNQMFLAREGRTLVGMVAVHGQAPFSVAARLPPGECLEQLADRPLEVRLLCVIPGRRSSRIAFQLMAAVYDFAQREGYRELWISGVEEQLPLYRRLGFTALGPPVTDGEVAFTPMRVPLDQLPPALTRLAESSTATSESSTLSLLPGPARLNPATTRAANSAQRYHRSESYLHTYRKVQHRLSRWTAGHGVALFPGGGTHANDVLAQTLLHLPSSRKGPGLILCNGEFGRRLVAHAKGARLPHQVLDSGWARPWDLDAVRDQLQSLDPAWVWAVHCESSTSMLNPIEELVDLVQAQATEEPPICLDAISTLGVLPLPRGIAFATAVSGKGLQALPGMAIVAAESSWCRGLEKGSWPPSMDLPAHWNSSAPPHTLGYPVLASLEASLSTACDPDHADARLQGFSELGSWIRKCLRQLGVHLVVPESASSPFLTTFQVPDGLTTHEFLNLSSSWGFQLAGHSPYLRGRRLAQIATYGDFVQKEILPLFASWARWQGQGPHARPIHLVAREITGFPRFSE